MKKAALVISKATQRRFILGKQGLFPGRRWRGKAGVAQALRESCVIQIECAPGTSKELTGIISSGRPAQL